MSVVVFVINFYSWRGVEYLSVHQYPFLGTMFPSACVCVVFNASPFELIDDLEVFITDHYLAAIVESYCVHRKMKKPFIHAPAL